MSARLIDTDQSLEDTTLMTAHEVSILKRAMWKNQLRGFRLIKGWYPRPITFVIRKVTIEPHAWILG